MGPGRLHALIDGVFAIALTLLVLDLPKPQHSTRLVHDLLQQWPSYVAYLVSFVTLGILWIEHHGMMGAVRSIDRRFLERTLAFLLFISVIPWPTALAADYARQGIRRGPCRGDPLRGDDADDGPHLRLGLALPDDPPLSW